MWSKYIIFMYGNVMMKPLTMYNLMYTNKKIEVTKKKRQPYNQDWFLQGYLTEQEPGMCFPHSGKSRNVGFNDSQSHQVCRLCLVHSM
jgi:hypothetical protein